MKKMYSFDTRLIHITTFRDVLKTKLLLPGRVILKEDIDKRFEVLVSRGIANLEDLLENLKSRARIEACASATGLSAEYLTILRREAQSYIPAPVNLSKIPHRNTTIATILAAQGIKDTCVLLEKAARVHDRTQLAQALGVDESELLELVQLSDLVRITGVGPVFARLIWETGIRSVKELMATNKDRLLESLSATNMAKGITTTSLRIEDLDYCFELGRFLPDVVEW